MELKKKNHMLPILHSGLPSNLVISSTQIFLPCGDFQLRSLAPWLGTSSFHGRGTAQCLSRHLVGTLWWRWELAAPEMLMLKTLMIPHCLQDQGQRLKPTVQGSIWWGFRPLSNFFPPLCSPNSCLPLSILSSGSGLFKPLSPSKECNELKIKPGFLSMCYKSLHDLAPAVLLSLTSFHLPLSLHFSHIALLFVSWTQLFLTW